ncbi:MAG: hypothetical protein M1839_005544 [Geoglossum umbratile]|nr:MAG: hypothetical protein M1839_005544 [Geoglossum umbratile]
MPSVTRGKSTTPTEVQPPYLVDQLTREGQKARVHRTNKLAEDAPTRGALESKMHGSWPISKDQNPRHETLKPKKRLLSRLLSFGTSSLTKDSRQLVLPLSAPHTPLKSQQDESSKPLSHGRGHGSRAIKESRTPHIGKERDGQRGRLLPPTEAHIPKKQPPSVVGDCINHGLADAAFSKILDGNAPGFSKTCHNPAYAPSRDLEGGTTIPQQTTSTITEMPTILEVDSFVSMIRQTSSMCRGRVGFPPSNKAQARTGNAPLPSTYVPPETLPTNAHLGTCLDQAIELTVSLSPSSRESFFHLNGWTESKRRNTYNWIQGLPESNGRVFDTQSPRRVSSVGQTLVPHRFQDTPEPLNTSLPRAEDCPVKAHGGMTITQWKPTHGRLPLASEKASRDSIGLISSQIRGCFGSVIGWPYIYPPGEISARGPSTASSSATIRRIPSDPFPRVMLTAPGVPIATSYRMSRRVVWARAMVAREVRERDQLLQRRAKMGWD